MQVRTQHIAIVGAGPGGLAVAMLLAAAGARVTVFERLQRPGGRSGTIAAESDAGTFRFDIGPTFFLYPRILAEIFAACGERLADHVDLIRLDPQYRLDFEEGGPLDAHAGPEALAREVARFSPEDAANLPRFMAENRAKLEAFRPVLEEAFPSWRRFLAPAMLRALPTLHPFRTLDTELARHFSDPRVRLAFSFQSKYLGMSPFRCPSLFSILAFMEYEFGVHHPRGGMGAVIGAMARVARRQGVEMRLGEGVDEILFEGRRAVGVRTREGEQRFDAVVVNADFAHAMTRLVPDALRRRWTDRRIARKTFSCSTFMLYLGLEGLDRDVAHHTIHLARDYRRNIDEIEGGTAPPTTPSFYVQNACVTDPALAPPGHSTLYMLLPVANLREGGVDWSRHRDAFRALAIERLERIGVRDVDRRIRYEKVVTPADWAADHAIHRGATFNLAHTITQMLHWRPRNRFEDLDGLYLVGGGTHPGSGLPVIFEGARITARLLGEDLGLSAARLPSTSLEPALAEAL